MNKQSGKGKSPLLVIAAVILAIIGYIFNGTDPSMSYNDTNYNREISYNDIDSDVSDNTDSQEESIIYNFRKEENLISHFEKHKKEFEYTTAEEYLEGANRVINTEGVLHKTEAEDGDDVYYLEETNELVIVSTDGYIRTYFKPSAGIAYYNRK